MTWLLNVLVHLSIFTLHIVYSSRSSHFCAVAFFSDQACILLSLSLWARCVQQSGIRRDVFREDQHLPFYESSEYPVPPLSADHAPPIP